MSSEHKFGRNPDVDASAVEDVWDGQGKYVWMSHPQKQVITSTSDQDRGHGTGVGSIRCYGLSAEFFEQEEVVDLDGTTEVESAHEYLRFHRMEAVENHTSDRVNHGTLTARGKSSGIVTAQVTAGMNQTLMAIYTIPANFRAADLLGFYASIINGTGNVFLWVRSNGVFNVKHVLGLSEQGTSYVNHRFHSPQRIGSMSDVKVSIAVDNNNADVSAGFEIDLIR